MGRTKSKAKPQPKQQGEVVEQVPESSDAQQKTEAQDAQEAATQTEQQTDAEVAKENPEAEQDPVIHIPTKDEMRVMGLSNEQLGYGLRTTQRNSAPPPPKQCKGDALGPQDRMVTSKLGRGISYNVAWTIPNELRHKFEGDAEQYLVEFVNGVAHIPQCVAEWYQEQAERQPGHYSVN